IIDCELQRGFDLAVGPLFRVQVIRLAHDESVLVFTMHHIISDGWSAGILVREISSLYEAFSAGCPSLLGELPIQYVDYSAWQRQWITGTRLDNELCYWRNQLKAAPPVLQLPTDRVRPVVQSYSGGHTAFAGPSKQIEALLRAGRKHSTTLFMTTLAALYALLYRYTGEEDIVIGSPVAGRNNGAIEGIIGLFVNTLALRTRISGTEPICDLLKRVREVSLEAYAHQDAPF